MSLQLFRRGSGRCPHTLVPLKALAVTETLKGIMPWCPIPPSACRKGLKVSLLSGVSVCWQGSRFSAALGCLTPSTGKPHSCHSSLGYHHSRNTVQTRWHHALCSCWACRVSGSPELPYLLCPTGCIITRLTGVLSLHPLSDWAALQNHVSSSEKKSKGVSVVLVSALCFVGTHKEQSLPPSTAPLEQSFHSPSTPHSQIFHFLAYIFCGSWTCLDLWLPCFDPIHKYQEGSFLHLFFFPSLAI